MGRLSHRTPSPPVEYVDESVDIAYHEPSELAAQVEQLRQPWIADEGPLDADFWQHAGGELPRPLHFRGLAFDDRVTVAWDEDIVQVIRPREADGDVIARRSEVLIRERFTGPVSLHRVDYLRHGVLLASRYEPGGTADA